MLLSPIKISIAMLDAKVCGSVSNCNYTLCCVCIISSMQFKSSDILQIEMYLKTDMSKLFLSIWISYWRDMRW